MDIAIVGAGGIGSTLAVQLAAKHDVTLVARNRRLAQLQAHGGVRTPQGLVSVQLADALPPEVSFDLVVVPVLAHQVDALLPSLRASKARQVMFMFNTFAPLSALRDAVGAARFQFGFPAILAQVDGEGVLQASIVRKGMLTTLTDAGWASVFSAAGMPATTTHDMESWLRSHAAAVLPVMLAAAESHRTRAGIDWSRARALAAVMQESFALVRELGHDVIPLPHALLAALPQPAAATLLWTLSRARDIRKSGAAGEAESRALIDTMVALAPHALPALERAGLHSRH